MATSVAAKRDVIYLNCNLNSFGDKKIKWGSKNRRSAPIQLLFKGRGVWETFGSPMHRMILHCPIILYQKTKYYLPDS